MANLASSITRRQQDERVAPIKRVTEGIGRHEPTKLEVARMATCHPFTQIGQVGREIRDEVMPLPSVNEVLSHSDTVAFLKSERLSARQVDPHQGEGAKLMNALLKSDRLSAWQVDPHQEEELYGSVKGIKTVTEREESPQRFILAELVKIKDKEKSESDCNFIRT
jgi:hypothetical protein